VHERVERHVTDDPTSDVGGVELIRYVDGGRARAPRRPAARPGRRVDPGVRS
jgi:hypothetical protein